MMAPLDQLADPLAAGTVLTGTLIATFARSGRHESMLAMRYLTRLAGRRFNEGKMRASLAKLVNRIRKDGVIRTETPSIDDRELSDATLALVQHRSVMALRSEHDRHRCRRECERLRASQTFYHAAEVAPVFGLAGTLLALAGLASETGDIHDFGSTISMAVVSTLYGIGLAHLICVPLGRAIEREGLREEAARERLVDWLAEQSEPACPASSSSGAK